MGGVNLQDGLMEVALEQWIERCHNYNKTVSFNAVPALWGAVSDAGGILY